MAQVIIEDNRVARPEWQIWLQVVGFGAIVGAVYWLLALLIGRYIVEPLACRDVVSAVACTDASVLAGKLSTVIVALMATFGMIRAGVARPLIVAVASAAVLWSLSEWTNGLFWGEALAWSIILYALAYGLFGWIARHVSAIVAIILAILVAVAIRVGLMFV